MIDRTHKIFIIIGVVFAAVILFVSRPFEGRRHAKENVSVAEMEARIQRLQTELNALVQVKSPAEISFKKEKEKIDLLERKLKESASEKDSLARELSQAKADLELTRTIRKRIDAIASSLDSLRISRAGEEEIRRQLKGIAGRLDGVDSALQPLLKEKKAQSQDTRQARDKELGVVTGQLKTALKENASLETKLAESEQAIETLKGANVSLAGGLKTLESDLKEIDGKQAELIKEKQEAIRAKLDAVKNAESLKDNLLNLDRRNRDLSKESQSLKEELTRLHSESVRLGAERDAVRRDLEAAKAANENSQKLRKEIAQLQNQMEQVNKDYARLKEEYANTAQTIQQNKTTLGERAEKIISLQEKLSQSEAALNGMQAQIQAIEKESALLREEYVLMQIEREELKRQLALTSIKFNDAQSKLQQIGTIFAAPAETSTVGAEAKEIVPPEQAKEVAQVPQVNNPALPGTPVPEDKPVKKAEKKVSVELSPQPGP